MHHADRTDELLTLAIREAVRKEWDDMTAADASEVKKNPKFCRMQKRVASMIRNGPRKGKKQARSMKKRWLPAIIAAGLLLLLLAAPVVAAVIGNTTLGDILRRMGEDFFKLPYDTPIDIDGITVIRRGNVTTYAEIGDFLEQEGISVLWPTWLPEGLKVKKIVVYHDECIVYNFNSDEYSFGIYKDVNDPRYQETARNEIIRIGEIEVEGLFRTLDYPSPGYLEVIFDYGGYQYYIISTDEEEARHILDGLVEMKP